MYLQQIGRGLRKKETKNQLFILDFVNNIRRHGHPLDIGYYNFDVGLISTDYLGSDLAGCTFAGVFEEDGKLYTLFIADSGIAIAGEEGEVRFKTPDEGPNSKGSIDEDIKNQLKFIGVSTK